MKEYLKTVIVNLFNRIIRFLGNNKIVQIFFEEVIKYSLNKVGIVTHNGQTLRFAVPNSITLWRLKTFSTKEPETLEWIDSIPKGSIFWDIGANVGIYSIYAAKKSECKVYSFEPSVFNIELLARNIYLNDLSEEICILPIALNDKLSLSQMRMSTTEWGGALSTFEQKFGFDGRQINQTFSYKLLGISMEDAVLKLGIPVPEYMKIDVDGLEHFILNGGLMVLSKVKEILIEINEDFKEQQNACSILLTQSGLYLKEKKHSFEVDNSEVGFQNTYNQIWVRAQC